MFSEECIHQYLTYNNVNLLITAVHRARLQKTVDIVKNRGLTLDAGCGDGFLLERLQGSKIGIDLDIRRLRRAKKRSPDSMLICADLKHIPLVDNVFDTVVSIDFLEHIPNPEVAMEEIKRISKNNGEIVVASPEEENWELARKFLMQKPLEDHINDIKLEYLEEVFGKRNEIKRVPFDFFKLSLWKVVRFVNKV